MADYQIEYEAVFLFSSLKVVGQLTFEQFEKTIEHNESREQLKGRTVKAAHVQLDGQLNLRTLVLFTLPFDENGIVDSQWDIPLRHLAQMATKGPDLGKGRINISCRSQCSVDWYQQDLWEPDGSQTQDFFDGLLTAIKSNKLDFQAIEKYEDEVLLKDMENVMVLDEELPSLKPAKKTKKVAVTHIEEEFAPVLTATALVDDEKEDLKKQILINHEKSQQKVAQLLNEQRIKYDQVIQRKNNELEQTQRVLRNEMQADKQMVQALQRKISQFQVQLESSETMLSQKDEAVEDLEFKYEQQNERFNSLKTEHQNLSRLHNNHKHNQSDDEDVNELTEEINSLQMQLEGALNREDDLVQELKILKSEKQEAQKAPDADSVLVEKMVEQELIFTAYHPGAGHLSVPARNVLNYLKNPNQYAAQKCSVKLKDYEIWLKHFENPICEVCGIQIDRVNTPTDFIASKNTFCTTHR